MKKKNKQVTISQSFAISLIVPGAILVALLIESGILFSLAAYLDNNTLYLVGLIISIILLIEIFHPILYNKW